MTGYKLVVLRVVGYLLSVVMMIGVKAFNQHYHFWFIPPPPILFKTMLKTMVQRVLGVQ